MRTPSSALPAWPQGFELGFGRPFPATAVVLAVAFLAPISFFFTTGFFAAAFVFLVLTRFAIVVPFSLSRYAREGDDAESCLYIV
jgi:hypothetical protein